MRDLTCRCLTGLEGISASDLGRLFPEPSSAAPLLALLQESGLDGYQLRSIAVFQGEVPVLLLPLFETRFDLSAFAEGWVGKALQTAGLLFPPVFRPKILGVGLLAGEWSDIGVDPGLDGDTRAAAGLLAFGALDELAHRLKSDVVALFNFNEQNRLPKEVFTTFNRVQYRPCAVLEVNFASMEEYLGSLSRIARKGVRRKMRGASGVRVVRSRDIAPFLERIYLLYLNLVQRSPMALGAHNKLFFEKICARVPGAEYLLYFVEDELAAFNLVIVKPESTVDIFFCMDRELGREHNLYFLSWLENVRTCVERKIPLYYAGQGTEETKGHLGVSFIPSYILFRHRWRAFDRFLVGQPGAVGRFLGPLRYWADVKPRS